MNAALERLRVLAVQTPLARLSRLLGKADAPPVSGRHARRVPELRAFVLDGNRLLFDADELRVWLSAKAEEYLGEGEGYAKMMNAGRVDGYWTTIGEIEQLQRLLASVDTHAERCDVEQAQPARVGSAVPSETSADAQEQPLEPKD